MEEELQIRQWTGYDPPVDEKFLSSGAKGIPPQWHLEASTKTPSAFSFNVTLIRPYRKGSSPDPAIVVDENRTALYLQVKSADGEPVSITIRKPGNVWSIVHGIRFAGLAVVKKGKQEWRVR